MGKSVKIDSDVATLLARKNGFQRSLLNWFRRSARDLPWRGVGDPYVVWVSEIVLQQTRISQGTPYIDLFVRAFPTVRDLAMADMDEVLKLWEGLGYYARAHNLHKAAREVVDHRHGALPIRAKDWGTLPGIGRYTAGAIASIAHGERVPAVDGNVKRVVARLVDLEAPIDDGKTTDLIWSIVGELVSAKHPGDFNQGIMDLGANVCTPRNPSCGSCPVARYCAAFEANTQAQRPVRRARKSVPHHHIVVAAIAKNGRYLIGKRPANGLLGGLWELPGGKIEKGETPRQALVRETKEELGIKIRVRDFVATVDHAYSHFKVTLHIYRCQQISGKPTPTLHDELKWVLPRDFERYAFPGANHKFLDLL